MKQVRDFRFKRFTVSQNRATHKVGTDGVLLGTWVRVQHAKRVLDIGTGSGVIALILAQRSPDTTTIDGIEVQQGDFDQAMVNFNNSPWNTRLRAIHLPVQEFSPPSKYDLIVSNPPYFRKSHLPPDPARTIVRHDERLSLDELVDAAGRLLCTDGVFAVILPVAEGREFQNLARDRNLHCIRECAFRARPGKPVERLLMEFSFQPTPLVRGELVLYSHGEAWTDEYWSLTGEFYLERKV
ncbi:MAG TPA: methyltransferase [Chryseosolibacter sp.]|nr:methyltransferase [Chryseosolibacter sp.]